MKTLHKYSITIGIIASAAALLFQDAWTAVLAGVVAAGLATWICSLEWDMSGKFARVTSLKIGIDLSGLKNVAWATVTFMPKRIFVEIPRMMKNDVRTRRIYTHTALLTILTLMATRAIVCLSDFMEVTGDLSELVPFSEGVVYVLACAATVPFFIFGIVALFMSYLTIANIFCMSFFSSNLIKSLQYFKGGTLSLATKYLQFAEDDTKDAIVSAICMLGARVLNAINILFVLPALIVFYGMFALASKKAGLKIMIAMFLAGIYLSFAYDFGGISLHNPNFWLAFSLAAMSGAWIGGKVHDEINLELPEFPSFDHFNVLVKN